MTPVYAFSRDQLDGFDKESLITLILSMQEQISTMAAEMQSLRDQVAKNSRNSGKPPSSDGYAKSRPKSLRAKGKRKSGGQPGHPGKTLERVYGSPALVLKRLLRDNVLRPRHIMEDICCSRVICCQ